MIDIILEFKMLKENDMKILSVQYNIYFNIGHAVLVCKFFFLVNYLYVI